jgi:hypothetical protein
LQKQIDLVVTWLPQSARRFDVDGTKLRKLKSSALWKIEEFSILGYHNRYLRDVPEFDSMESQS